MDSICMYTPEAHGGHALYSWEVLSALTRHPHNGFRFELVSSENLQREYQSKTYPVHMILPPLRERSTFSSRWTWGASRVMHYSRRERQFLAWLRSRPDVVGVHLQQWTPWLAAGLIRRIHAMDKRVFFTVHNVVPHKYPSGVPRWVVDRFVRQACLKCDGLFVHTDALAAELSRFLGTSHPPIHVVPHGVWTVHDPTGIPNLSERLTWKKLLFFGNQRRNKGLDLLLKASELLPDYSITIVGQPLEREYFETEIIPEVRRLIEEGRSIDLQPYFVPDDAIAPLMAAHSAIVLPYTREFVAQSGVVFTALAGELPVIASEAGGLFDLFERFQIGVMFREQTPEALAAAVRQLFERTDHKQLMQQICAARQRFSWDHAAAATLAGYRAGLQGAVPSHDGTVVASTISAH